MKLKDRQEISHNSNITACIAFAFITIPRLYQAFKMAKWLSLVTISSVTQTFNIILDM